MQYRKPTKAEYAIIMKENHFSDLLFQWMSKFIQPAGILLFWTAWLCILLIVLTVLTGEDIFLTYITYVWPFMLCIIAVILIPIFIVIIFSSYLMRSLIWASYLFQKSKVIVEPFDQIIKKTKHIHTLISVIYRMNKFISLFLGIKAINKINMYLQKNISDLMNFLIDLRSDLASRLTEQRQILESAKTEVEENITGTPELIAVSELQKTRLDRQIEQLEELQRVLVRV